MQTTEIRYESDVQGADTLGVHFYPAPFQGLTEEQIDEVVPAMWAAIYDTVWEVAQRHGLGVCREGLSPLLPEQVREWLRDGCLVIERNGCDRECAWVAVSYGSPEDGGRQQIDGVDALFLAEDIARALNGLTFTVTAEEVSL